MGQALLLACMSTSIASIALRIGRERPPKIPKPREVVFWFFTWVDLGPPAPKKVARRKHASFSQRSAPKRTCKRRFDNR